MTDYDGELFDSLDESDPGELRAIIESTITLFPDEMVRGLQSAGAELRASVTERLPELDLSDYEVQDTVTVLVDELMRPVIRAMEIVEVDEDSSQAVVAITMGAVLFMLEPASDDGGDR